ncbi:MAG: Threonyl/alanyl tRNA synthetase SAD [Parcubacteria group bacterium GW2011_GWB1_41_5]|nr:MAG: Threonyl/alanyl tRNA synthetase SAD [Parcubacteria group bacterium GW2011_GWB1_41_5]KKS33427.1 MAG: Threonyl/alanyl tRNA synthetase SAD [Parcubacteria group bacterium GW2011_GWC2_42_13]
MRTEKLYFQDSYKQEYEAKILSIAPKGNQTVIELDQTIFYPEGGGQPSDQGEIIGVKGRLKVQMVSEKDGKIFHQGLLEGELKMGENVKCQLKWSLRYRNMRIHSAGHLIHDVLVSLENNLAPSKGSHGQKAFLEYNGEAKISKDELEVKVNEAIKAGLPILAGNTTLEELKKECDFISPNLPKNKELRYIKIGNYKMMPDGGIQVKSTLEIGQVFINAIEVGEGKTIIKYRV